MADHVDKAGRTVLLRSDLKCHVVVERRRAFLPSWEERTKKLPAGDGEAIKRPGLLRRCLECGEFLPANAHGRRRRHTECAKAFLLRTNREYMREVRTPRRRAAVAKG